MTHSFLQELRHHAPFTAIGAFSGIVLMLIFRNFSQEFHQTLFYIFHPLHVFLSALVTVSLYRLHMCPPDSGKQCNVLLLFFIGFVGAIGIATLSDSIIPYWGEVLLGMPHRHHHIGFIEHGWLVGGAAMAGILVAWFYPITKEPHTGHVLLSTWASSFHMLMAKEGELGLLLCLSMLLFLFLAVWVPCCISDIVFPMLFVKDDHEID